jgi:hypothetical protein
MDEFLKSIPGAVELLAWFGHWPSFHDAEIVSLTLNRSGVSILRVHTWQMTSQIDERGYYVLDKHIVVNFQMEEIQGLQLVDFSPQNLIFGLTLREIEGGFQIEMDPCYGLAGTISARKLSLEFEPVPGGLL